MLSRTAIDDVGARLRKDSSDVAALAELTLFREHVAVKTKDAADRVRAQTTAIVSARSGKSSQSAISIGEASWEESPDLDSSAEQFIYEHYDHVQVQRVLYRSVLESKQNLRTALLSIIPG